MYRERGWTTFLHHHAQAIVACDFCVAVSVTFQLYYVFVVIEHRSRKLLHVNVTKHPSAAWTQQQLREALPAEHKYRVLLHDRDSIFSAAFDTTAENLGLRVIKTPYRSPKANAVCERAVGTLRRECLDHLMPLSEKHLRHIVARWRRHYNTGRPHMALGGSMPDAPAGYPAPAHAKTHEIGGGHRVVSYSVFGGLSHEYDLALAA